VGGGRGVLAADLESWRLNGDICCENAPEVEVEVAIRVEISLGAVDEIHCLKNRSQDRTISTRLNTLTTLTILISHCFDN
jgi:hypothetical protein